MFLYHTPFIATLPLLAKSTYFKWIGKNIPIQVDQKVSVHLMIAIQKVLSNIQIFPRQSPDI
jgi:hypothetical protein